MIAVAMMMCAVGSTMAWLQDTTDPVTNTFTASHVDADLKEEETGTNYNYKMVPGWTLDKDPQAKVDANSEDCFLFVKVEESADFTHDGNTYKFDDYIAYAIDTDVWTALDGVDGVYYIEFDSDDETTTDVKGTYYPLLKGGSETLNEVAFPWTANQVLVKPTVTEEMMEAISGDNAKNQPKLTFTAYAVQLMKNNNQEFTATEAWALANPTT